MTSKLRIWIRGEDDRLVALAEDYPLWIPETASVPRQDQQENAVGIYAISSPSGAIGVALLPDELDNTAALNGVPLRAGLHLLRHSDRLDVKGRSVWFATSTVVETTTYDPRLHGENVFCYLTKARLEPGQAIVVCPAAPGKTCIAIYTERAWELAMQSATMRKCAHCGFRPDESEWRPSEPQPRKKIDELLTSPTERPL